MSRRGEGQFIAVEVGLRHDPKVLGLARALKVHAAAAVGYLVAWREFVLTRGTGGGVVHGYTVDEMAAFIGWPGSAVKIVTALKTAGFLGSRRRALVHPSWGDTITGHYAAKRAKDRDRQRTGKGDGGGTSGDVQGDVRAEVPRNGHGDSAEVPRSLRGGSEEIGTVSNKGFHGTPPGPPLEGGVERASALTEWFLETYPKVRNPKKIAKLLGLLTAEEVVQLRFCLAIHAPQYVDKKKGKGWRFVPYGDSYLEDGIFWEYRPPKPRQPEAVEVVDLEAVGREEQAREQTRQMWQLRAQIRSRLIEEGVDREQLEDRVQRELERARPS
jgi:hypothetical protein